MLRFLFLDIDGVLNSKRWWQTRPKEDDHAHTSRDGFIRRNIDPAAVARLQRICDATHPMVVLSSSWRQMYCLPLMTESLAKLGGFTHPILGATPALEPVGYVKATIEEGLFVGSRGIEIQAWIDRLLAHVTNPVTYSYVVLDDENVVGHDGFFVRTSFQEGLTDREADEAIRILADRPTTRLAGSVR